MRLVVLTDNFGLNFSGGAIATCRIFEPIQNDFSEVIVIGKQLGEHPFRHLRFLPYENQKEAIQHIRDLEQEGNVVFYGDFYMAVYFALTNVPFYFTYHDNWPEQKAYGWKNYFWSLYYLPLYQLIFRKAAWVFTVSNFKLSFIQQYTTKVSVVRNGINSVLTKKHPLTIPVDKPAKIIMLGNIDDRKFGWALSLFKLIKKKRDKLNFSIDIYGTEQDKSLARRLAAFEFVQLKGFHSDIRFDDYHLSLCTSKIENLSIAVCEALLNYTPVISFDVGGLHEVIRHEQNGCLIKAGDINAFYETLKKVLDGKINFRFDQSHLEDFDWEVAAAAYRKLMFET